MKSVHRLSAFSIVALCLALPATSRAQAVDPTVAAVTPSAAECARVEALSNTQRRVVDQAAGGVKSLISFVHGTRMIYQLDLMETVRWLEARQASQRACAIAAASDAIPAQGE